MFFITGSMIDYLDSIYFLRVMHICGQDHAWRSMYVLPIMYDAAFEDITSTQVDLFLVFL